MWRQGRWERLNDLYAAIFDAISTCATTSTAVYLERAKPDATFPYITFALPFSVSQPGTREDFNLAVDIWSTSNSTSLEALVDRVDGNGVIGTPSGLNRRKHVAANTPSFYLNRVSRMMVPDPDETIRRRRLTYRVSVYDSSSS
jgi:hypothetical protein